ncbi:MBL fold metallo-hydrolase [Plastoroseomonas hellenica]|uniref:MBL fold metallo-hydrolase n=1 Tax=Plastoroseomonas hellenica TaxID=2687306 RepID=UPI001BADD44B|nr:MBL fold metallo-hydrolase [Plastoroseomonas hellenica]MBR0641417.1 MBL fold metallo-hydrolase [Plastoroseomonas hellenica]
MRTTLRLPAEASAVNDAVDRARGDGTHEVAPGLAYLRLAIVNVAFIGRHGAGDRDWMLVDAGLPGTRALIERAAARRFGSGSRPAAILLTHGHFDHVGALEGLARHWDVPVIAHRLELPYLDGTAAYPQPDPSVGGGLMSRLSPLLPRRPVDVGSRLIALPQDGSVPMLAGWRWIHTPGHSVGHVSFWREEDQCLLSGDAFVTTRQESLYATAMQKPEMHGPPAYFTVDWQEAGASVRRLAQLGPDLVVSGHGRAMRGPHMQAALRRLAAEFELWSTPERGRYVTTPATVLGGTAYIRK